MTENTNEKNVGFGFENLSTDTKLQLIYNDQGIIHAKLDQIAEKQGIIYAKLDQIAEKIGLTQPTTQQPKQVSPEIAKEEADDLIEIM